MYSKAPTGKASKGSVSILVSNGRLQLRLRYAGKRHYISLGFSDTPQNRKLAEMKAREIELDILSGHFDQSLAKYKPHSAFTTESPDITPKVTPTIQELWEQYTNYKSSSVKETTRHYYTSFSRLFERLGDVPLMDALQVKARLENVTTVHQAKKTLMQLNAACNWAIKHGLVDSNPYDGMANEMPKYRYQLEPKPNAFTEEERDRVVQAFKDHKGNWNGRGYTGSRYNHYAPFVEFLFLTGCRPSEAIGLRWKHVSADGGFIRFEGSVTTSGNRVVDPIKPDTTPYSCRDTFITTQILKGVPESVIAEWCDTSVEMIQKHYADFLKMLSLRPID